MLEMLWEVIPRKKWGKTFTGTEVAIQQEQEQEQLQRDLWRWEKDEVRPRFRFKIPSFIPPFLFRTFKSSILTSIFRITNYFGPGSASDTIFHSLLLPFSPVPSHFWSMGGMERVRQHDLLVDPFIKQLQACESHKIRLPSPINTVLLIPLLPEPAHIFTLDTLFFFPSKLFFGTSWHGKVIWKNIRRLFTLCL